MYMCMCDANICMCVTTLTCMRVTNMHRLQVLVNVLLIGKLFKFGHQRTILKMPSMDAEDELGAAAKKFVSQTLPPEHGEFFERQELEKMIARLVHERHLAVIQLHKFSRRLCAGTIFLAARVEFKEQDESTLLLQAMSRRLLQGVAGRGELTELRREARLMALGADLQCLELMSLAQDGDVITVPKGRHYPRITTLADGMSLSQSYMQVSDASCVSVYSPQCPAPAIHAHSPMFTPESPNRCISHVLVIYYKY